MDLHRHAEQIDLKWETARAGSVAGASAASFVAENNSWALADIVTVLTILYIILQIGLVLHKYWKIWKGSKSD